MNGIDSVLVRNGNNEGHDDDDRRENLYHVDDEENKVQENEEIR